MCMSAPLSEQKSDSLYLYFLIRKCKHKEQASDSSYDALLPEGLPTPLFHQRLNWRLRSSWLPPTAAEMHHVPPYEYRDPFAALVDVSRKPDDSDKAKAKRRERLRAHIGQARV